MTGSDILALLKEKGAAPAVGGGGPDDANICGSNLYQLGCKGGEHHAEFDHHISNLGSLFGFARLGCDKLSVRPLELTINRDFPRPQGFGNFAHKADTQQAIRQVSAVDANMIGPAETGVQIRVPRCRGANTPRCHFRLLAFARLKLLKRLHGFRSRCHRR